MRVIILIIVSMAAGNASAYIGPGLGGGLLGTLLAIFFGLFVVVGALLYYPIKALVKKAKKESSDRDGKKKMDRSSLAQSSDPDYSRQNDNTKEIDDH